MLTTLSKIIIGLQLEKVCAIDKNGELHPLFHQVQIMQGPDRGGGLRALVVELAKIEPNPIAGAVSFLTGQGDQPTPEADQGQTPVTPMRSEEAGSKPAKVAKQKAQKRSTDDLLNAFVAAYKAGGIIDLVDDRDVEADVLDGVIGLRKDDPSWTGPRLFLLSSAMNAFFPDRRERRAVVQELKAKDVIVPNEGRGDTDLVSVQVAGKTFKAFRLKRKRLNDLLGAN